MTTPKRPRFKKTHAKIEVNRLTLAPRANRELRPTRLRQLVTNMNLDKLGSFAAWRERRILYVIDGQHRKLALEELGLGDWEVDVDVYENCKFEDACDLFLGLNDSLLVRPYDRFDKGVKAGYEAECETKRIVEERGLRVRDTPGGGCITAVSALLEAYGYDRGGSLGRALDWLLAIWGSEPVALEGEAIRAFSLLAAKYNGQIQDDALIKKLSKFPGGPANLHGRAKGQREMKGGTIARNMAMIVVDVYNKGRRTHQLQPF